MQEHATLVERLNITGDPSRTATTPTRPSLRIYVTHPATTQPTRPINATQATPTIPCAARKPGQAREGGWARERWTAGVGRPCRRMGWDAAGAGGMGGFFVGPQ
jgi:hypothetical protein